MAAGTGDEGGWVENDDKIVRVRNPYSFLPNAFKEGKTNYV